MEVGNSNKEKATGPAEKSSLSRRGFLKVVGMFTISASGAGFISCDDGIGTENPPNASMGYILVDSRKCQGCLSCMVACSLVNEGCVSLSLSRIQVAFNSFACYPNDTRSTQCHQCLEPKCVAACPVGACTVDKANDNIRMVDKDKCIGCGMCAQACPFEPKRSIIAPDDSYGGSLKSRKCDLCTNATHHFDPRGGGVKGVRACEATCPLGAIKFATVMPVQIGEVGYDVNLRDYKWSQLGFDTKL